jgi:hypothetical protein
MNMIMLFFHFFLLSESSYDNSLLIYYYYFYYCYYYYYYSITFISCGRRCHWHHHQIQNIFCLTFAIWFVIITCIHWFLSQIQTQAMAQVTYLTVQLTYTKLFLLCQYYNMYA